MSSRIQGKTRQLLLVAFLAISLAAPAFALDIYVDNSLAQDCAGNYSVAERNCSGSDGIAFNSLQGAYNNAVAGDTVLFRDGNYTTASYYSAPANSGTAESPITFKNYPGEHVYFKGTWTANGSSCTGTPMALSNKTNLIFDGFEISNYCICISMYSNSSNITLRNMKLHDCIYGVYIRGNSSNVLIENAEGYRNSRYNDGGCGVSIRDSSNILVKNFYSHDNDDLRGNLGDGDGFCASSGGDITFINCTAANNSEDGFDLTGLNVKLINSKSYNNGVNGVKTWRRSLDGILQPAYFTIINLISFNNGENGISASNGPDVSMYNSIIYNNGAQGIRFINAPEAAKGVVYNNIIMGNGFFSPVDNSCCYTSFVVGTNWNVAANYNLYYNNWGDKIYPGEGSNSLLSADPLFADSDNNNFRLQAGSPAIDNGTDLPEIFNYDIEGRLRPQGAGWDMGAFEFEGTAGQCGNGSIDSGENCSNCPQDAACTGGTICCGNSCTAPACTATTGCTSGRQCTNPGQCSAACQDINCQHGAITSSCYCQGSARTTGYCCNNVYQETPCQAPATCGNGTVDSEENCSNCQQDAACQTGQTCQNGTCIALPECIDTQALMSHISQWKQGNTTMLILMQKMAAWKKGTGCS